MPRMRTQSHSNAFTSTKAIEAERGLANWSLSFEVVAGWKTTMFSPLANGQMQLAWPQDHLGWRLQIQTNNLTGGLGTNWTTLPNSTNVIATNIVINPTDGSVFFRMIYP